LEELEQFTAKLEETLAAGGEFALRELAVNGTDIIQEAGVKPGPLVGVVLRKLWDEVLEDPEKNNRVYLLARAKRIIAELNSQG